MPPAVAPRTRAPSAARGTRGRGRPAGPAARAHVAGGVVRAPAGAAIKLKNPKAAKDPRFQKVMDKLHQSASKAKEHEPPAKKAAEAQNAAQPPANEKLAGAKANQVDAIKEADTKKPEPNSFLAMLRAEIQKVMPKKVEEGNDFMKGDDKQQLKSAMTGNVSQQKDEAAAGMKGASSQPLDPSQVQGKEVEPLPAQPPPAAPPPIGAADAMPAPKPAADVSLQQGKQDGDKVLTDAKVTPTQLQKANDPRFSAVLTAKSAADKAADALPQTYRGDEQKAVGQAAAKAVADEQKNAAAMRGEKGKAGGKVKARQLTAKEKDEAARKAVTDRIEGIYTKTKQAVDDKLNSLEKDVGDIFDKGAETAIANMKAYVEVRFDDRYSGITGDARWVRDKLLPLPPEVKAWFDQARQAFTDELDALVVRVAALVETRLKEAKDLVAQGQKEISEYVAGLSPELQSVGRAAEQDMKSRFDELRQGIDDKKNDLAQNLAQRYKDASEKADAALKEMKDAHKSLIEKIRDAIAEVIKILKAFRDRIMGMLKKGQETLDLIIADPIQFLKNLLAAIKQGINQFKDRIWDHLKAGFMKWLFGSLANAGITMPKDLSLPSILLLVMQVLGITYAGIRAKAVKLIGERNVMILEKAFELIKALIDGGPAALWEQIKEFLGDLKQAVIDAIQDWVVTSIVKAAITKLATMFNPVGAIIQAIITIYNTVMFFIERIDQILDFVEAIINSVNKIATGDIGSAANWVEQALARTIPVIIGFLARLLGISGITDKIVSTIKKVQSRIDKAIDKVIEKIVGGIKKLFGGKDKPGPADTPEAKAGLAALDALNEKYKDGTTKEELSQAVAGVRAQHPVFKELFVKEVSGGLEYDYRFNPTGKKPGPTPKIVKIKLRRPGRFWKPTRETLQTEFSAEHKGNVARPLVKKGMARRHMISSKEVIDHYEKTLNGKTVAEAKALIEAKKVVTVGKPLSNKAIQEAAQELLRNFFNDTANLWVGDSAENSSIQEDRDFPDDMSPAEKKNHVATMKRRYFLDTK